MTKSRSKIIWLIAGIATVILAIALINPMQMVTPSVVSRSIAKQERDYIHALLNGCRAYAADNEGSYPPQLSALYPDYIDIKPLFKGRDENGKNKSPMIYYPGLTTSSDPDTPLIEHPFTFNGKKIVASAGGRVTNEKPAGK